MVLSVGRLGGVPIQGYSFDPGSDSMRKRVHVFGNNSTTMRVHSFFGNSSTRMRVHSSYTAYSFLSILFFSFLLTIGSKSYRMYLRCVVDILMCVIYLLILAPYTPGTDLPESFIKHYYLSKLRVV